MTKTTKLKIQTLRAEIRELRGWLKTSSPKRYDSHTNWMVGIMVRQRRIADLKAGVEW